MAKLEREEVVRLARLARLELTESEIEKMCIELGEILGYIDMLKKVDVSNLKPTSQVTGLTNVFREDEIIDYQATPDSLLQKVPKAEGRYIKVGRMIG